MTRREHDRRRTKTGRFAKGNRGGPGRPRNRRRSIDALTGPELYVEAMVMRDVEWWRAEIRKHFNATINAAIDRELQRRRAADTKRREDTARKRRR